MYRPLAFACSTIAVDVRRFCHQIKPDEVFGIHTTRYDKLTESFAAFVLLASIRIWIKLSTRPNLLN